LIVIVVIGILATLSIVAYNGAQNRGKTSTAKAAATLAGKKAHLYNVETGTYPAQASTLTGTTSDKSYSLSGVTINTTGFTTSALPASTNDLNFYRCGTNTTAAATNLATVTIITGVQFVHWDYMAGATVVMSTGKTSGNSQAGYTITCYITS
jgi:Tfp pilus assembly protein PilE